MKSRKNPTSRSSRTRVGITLGDPSGIGPSIIHKALGRLKGLAEFTVIGDRWVFEKARPSGKAGADPDFIDLKNVSRRGFSFGRASKACGRASIEYIDRALELIRAGHIDCLVTCPISKESIAKSGFKWPGHTEYLARRSKARDFAMMLLNRKLKLTLATRHIPIKDVARRLHAEQLRRAIILSDKALKELFLIKDPRIAVCGLNPHASDNGLIGSKENRLMKPLLKRLNQPRTIVDGPYSADVAIQRTYAGDYDCAIAMYHDQALIPLKMLGNQGGVNLTLGLRFIRTSPLHGTAFDIAGRHSLSDPASLTEAVRLAVRCSQNLRKD
ncbi:4-hydroxythreonine-4-phosphate dehydrogenase PdxA [Candidatus Omnitrophota bacterium]